MQTVLIGSRALQYWKPDLKLKHATDWDVISNRQQHNGCEIHDPWFLNNADMLKYASQDEVALPDGSKACVMSMLGLAIIKRSHLWRDIGFQKHITVFHKYGLHQTLMNPSPEVFKDLQTRIELTKVAFPQITPNLMQSNADFFDDAVTKVYEHDLLHELVAYEDKPLYTKLQRDSTKAWCCEDLWYNLTYKQKLQCIAEEVQVIAAERFLIPKQWNFSSRLAYIKALDKVCTTLCSGWFRDFAIDNYPQVFDLYDNTRFTVLQLKLTNIPKKGISDD